MSAGSAGGISAWRPRGEPAAKAGNVPARLRVLVDESQRGDRIEDSEIEPLDVGPQRVIKVDYGLGGDRLPTMQQFQFCEQAITKLVGLLQQVRQLRPSSSGATKK